MWKVWVGFGTIFGLGLGVGFFAGERYVRKKEADMAKLAQEEESLKQTMAEGTKIVEEAKEALTEYESDVDLDRETEKMNEYLSQFESPEEEDEEEKTEEPEAKTPQHQDDIIVVSKDVWDQNVDYDPIEISYYDMDHVFSNDMDERIEDSEDSIGQEAVDILDKYDFNEVNELYVQNNWTMELYRITRVHASYAEAILGIDDDFEFYHAEE